MICIQERPHFEPAVEDTQWDDHSTIQTLGKIALSLETQGLLLETIPSL